MGGDRDRVERLRVGLVALSAKGYGHIAWVVIAIYAVPLLTVGIWQIYRRRDR
jgi:hypothetical protein